MAQTLQNVIDKVRERMAREGNPAFYFLTFEFDALDPVFALGTGTPEIGGLTTDQSMTLLEAWYDGMDYTEVPPLYDQQN